MPRRPGGRRRLCAGAWASPGDSRSWLDAGSGGLRSSRSISRDDVTSGTAHVPRAREVVGRSRGGCGCVGRSVRAHRRIAKALGHAHADALVSRSSGRCCAQVAAIANRPPCCRRLACAAVQPGAGGAASQTRHPAPSGRRAGRPGDHAPRRAGGAREGCRTDAWPLAREGGRDRTEVYRPARPGHVDAGTGRRVPWECDRRRVGAGATRRTRARDRRVARERGLAIRPWPSTTGPSPLVHGHAGADAGLGGGRGESAARLPLRARFHAEDAATSAPTAPGATTPLADLPAGPDRRDGGFAPRS